MMEIFEHIRPEVKTTAEGAWELTMASASHNPIKAAELLNTIVEYYKVLWTQEEVEFLQFYFRMKMEMMDK